MDKLVITTIIVIVCLIGTNAQNSQNYCNICRNHTMCLYRGVGPACSRRIYQDVKDNATKQQILDIHNRYRRIVAKGQEKRGDPGPQPPAADMNMIKWDDELARVAQKWADQCTFQHDQCRNVARFSWVGQNLYISGRWQSNGVHPDPKQDWEEAIAAFYNEVAYLNNKNVDRFNAYSPKNGKEIGHYTQLVWGSTFLVGCGFSAYVDTKDGKDWFRKYYVCDYGPGGNVVGRKIYTRGGACSKCPQNSVCRDGLCDVSSIQSSLSEPSSSTSYRGRLLIPTLPSWFSFRRWFK